MFDFRQSLFLLELLTAIPIYCKNLKRSKTPFLLTGAAVFGAVLISGIPVFFRIMTFGRIGAFLYVGYYLLMFSLLAAIIRLFFSVALLELVIVSVLCYASQHLGYDVWMFIAEAASLPMTYETIFSAPYLTMQAGVYLITYFILFLSLGYRFVIDSGKTRKRWQWLAASFVLLLVAVIFNLFFIPEEGAGRTALFFIDGLCTVFGILTLCLITRRDALENELALMDQALRLRQEHYEITKESMDLINIKCHDIQKVISSMFSRQQNLFDDNTLREMTDSVRIYDAVFHTGNEALDVLLTEKSFLCQKDHIIFTCTADGIPVSFMSSMDIYSLFGNILDNAIEAVQRIPYTEQENRRVIDFTLTRRNSFLMIQERNYFTGALDMKDGLPTTKKQDENYHGYGMKSIQMIVSKYCGNMSFRQDGDIFILDILIPLPEDNRIHP